MQVNNYPNVSFKARKVATTRNVFKNVNTNINLYELCSKDNKFLSELKTKVNIKQMMPDLPEVAIESWQNILDFTINAAKDSQTIKYIAISDKKPCGIMVIQPNGKRLNLIGVASIPTDVNKKTNFVGNTLFCQLFRIAQDLKSNTIELEAVKSSPFNLVRKYIELGFKIDEEGERYISMSCNVDNVRMQLKKLLATILYKHTNSTRHKSLKKVVN